MERIHRTEVISRRINHLVCCYQISRCEIIVIPGAVGSESTSVIRVDQEFGVCVCGEFCGGWGEGCGVSCAI